MIHKCEYLLRAGLLSEVATNPQPRSPKPNPVRGPLRRAKGLPTRTNGGLMCLSSVRSRPALADDSLKATRLTRNGCGLISPPVLGDTFNTNPNGLEIPPGIGLESGCALWCCAFNQTHASCLGDH
jgi:hypothetical protein